MKVSHYENTEPHLVTMEGASGCRVRWLVGGNYDAPNFAMRQFEIEAGGHTPKHSHPYEHEVFVMEGTGVVVEDDREQAIKAGDVVYVAPEDVHQFRNTGSAPLKFLCMVPNSAATGRVTVAPECGRE